MKNRRMSEKGLERRLAHLLERAIERHGGMVRTFEQCGVLTTNRGLVIELPNRQEFQLTIVDSTRRY
jgi:hypothetical protein